MYFGTILILRTMLYPLIYDITCKKVSHLKPNLTESFRYFYYFMNSKIGIFGRKVCMTRQFDEQKGIVIPSTIVEVGLNRIIQLKTTDSWGYNSIVVAYDEKTNPKHLKKGQMSRLSSMSSLCASPASTSSAQAQHHSDSSDPREHSSKTRWLRSSGEFRIAEHDKDQLTEKFKVGLILDVRLFSVGQSVAVKGTPSGKGFMGNQQRHNFSRGPMTHGSKNHRRPGSLGASSTPSRVYPGKRMAGRSCTTVNVRSRVLMIDEENNILLLKGSVPGSSRTVLKIESNFRNH